MSPCFQRPWRCTAALGAPAATILRDMPIRPVNPSPRPAARAAARTRLASASPVSPNTPVVPLGSYWSDLRQGPGCDAGNQQAAARTRLASASPVSPNTGVVPVGSTGLISVRARAVALVAAPRTRLASASPVSPNTPVVPLGSYWSDLRQGPGCDAGNQQAAPRTRLASASPVSPNTGVVPVGSTGLISVRARAVALVAAARTRLASASPVSPNTPVVPLGSYWSDLRQGPGCDAGNQQAAARTRLASASPVSPNTPVVPLGSYWSDLRQGPGCGAGNQQAAARTRLASASPVSPNTGVVPVGSYWSDLRQGPGCGAGGSGSDPVGQRLSGESEHRSCTGWVYWSDLRQGPGCGAGGSGSDPVGQVSRTPELYRLGLTGLISVRARAVALARQRSAGQPLGHPNTGGLLVRSPPGCGAGGSLPIRLE